MKTLDERINDKLAEVKQLEQQLKGCDEALMAMQANRQQILLNGHLAQGALNALTELKAEQEEKPPEGS